MARKPRKNSAPARPDPFRIELPGHQWVLVAVPCPATQARQLADKAYRLWRNNHWHPSLHFKRVGGYWVARISEDYRAVGIESAGTVAWFWIGPHDEYDKLLAR